MIRTFIRVLENEGEVNQDDINFLVEKSEKFPNMLPRNFIG